jgi:hypothetical protein
LLTIPTKPKSEDEQITEKGLNVKKKKLKKKIEKKLHLFVFFPHTPLSCSGLKLQSLANLHAI